MPTEIAIKREVHEDMCKKLAIISVDLIKKKTVYNGFNAGQSPAE
jgi:hypothetical protein